MPVVIYVAPALAEIDEALAYYDRIDAVLQRRLASELRDGIARIQRFPAGWRPVAEGLRQYKLKSFPYVVIYGVVSEKIVIVAFAHTHRRPDYWKDRSKHDHP